MDKLRAEFISGQSLPGPLTETWISLPSHEQMKVLCHLMEEGSSQFKDSSFNTLSDHKSKIKANLGKYKLFKLCYSIVSQFCCQNMSTDSVTSKSYQTEAKIIILLENDCIANCLNLLMCVCTSIYRYSVLFALSLQH